MLTERIWKKIRSKRP